MRRTTAIIIICGALLAGAALGRLGFAASGWSVIATALAALILYRGRWFVFALAVLALMLGLWRAHVYTTDRAALLDLVGQPVRVTGTVSDDPAYDTRGFMTFRLKHLRINHQSYTGELKVRLYHINLHRGYQVQAEGKLRPPYYHGPPELSYPKLTVLSTDQSWLEQVRGRFFAGMRTALPEPAASFGLGLLVGIRSLIPQSLQDQLSLVGLSHLVAVSGYNLTIIVGAAHQLLERFGRGIALAASLWLIGLFLIITGASASIVRASLVSVLVLLAALYGRRFNPLVLILLVAAGTAAWRPAYLTDIGWLLSFLAFYGVMVLAPIVLARLGNPRPLIARLLAESTAAHLMTLPLILYFFAELSIVAPLSNLVILPLVPLAMLLSSLAGLAGMVLPAFAGWFAWPAGLLLQFMLSLTAAFAALPWAAALLHFDLPTMLACYSLLLLITWLIHRANRHRGRTTARAAPSLSEAGMITRLSAH